MADLALSTNKVIWGPQTRNRNTAALALYNNEVATNSLFMVADEFIQRPPYHSRPKSRPITQAAVNTDMHEAASYGQMAGHKENRWPSPRSSSCVKLHERYHLVLLEVLEAGLRVRLDGVSALLPLGRADLAVLAGELVALDEPQDLVHVPADIRLVHGEVLDDTIWVDDGGTAEGVAGIAHVPAVLLADLATEVADERILHRTETTLLAGSVDPGEVGEDGVDGEADDLAVDRLELVVVLAESDDLSWTDKHEANGYDNSITHLPLS